MQQFNFENLKKMTSMSYALQVSLRPLWQGKSWNASLTVTSCFKWASASPVCLRRPYIRVACGRHFLGLISEKKKASQCLCFLGRRRGRMDGLTDRKSHTWIRGMSLPWIMDKRISTEPLNLFPAPQLRPNWWRWTCVRLIGVQVQPIVVHPEDKRKLMKSNKLKGISNFIHIRCKLQNTWTKFEKSKP